MTMDIPAIRKSYDKIFTGKVYKEKEIYYKILAKLCEGRTLDIGCGNNASILSKVGDSVGVDLSEVAAKQLHEQGMTAVVGDGSCLPFKKEVFNTVISLGVLEHVLNPESAVREMHRVLMKAGQLILVVDAEKSFMFKFLNKIKRWRGRLKGGMSLEEQPVEKFFTKNQMVAMLYKSGFRIVFHGEYSKNGMEIKRVQKLISRLPFFLRSTYYVWFVIALKDIEGQEDVYGPYFPLRGFWAVKKDKENE